jgi:hypothetical protein
VAAPAPSVELQQYLGATFHLLTANCIFRFAGHLAMLLSPHPSGNAILDALRRPHAGDKVEPNAVVDAYVRQAQTAVQAAASASSPSSAGVGRGNNKRKQPEASQEEGDEITQLQRALLTAIREKSNFQALIGTEAKYLSKLESNISHFLAVLQPDGSEGGVRVNPTELTGRLMRTLVCSDD